MPAGFEMPISQRVIIVELLDMYKNMSYLWNQSHPSYQDRPLRLQGYKKLLAKYQEIDKDATVAVIKAKLDNMRTSYIRELKKVRASRNFDEVYTPSLWYYDFFNFLEDHVLKKPRRTPAESMDSSIDYLYYEDYDEGSQSNSDYDRMPVEYLEDQDSDDSCPQTKRHKVKVESADDSAGNSGSKRVQEDWEVIGRAIAIQLRDVEPQQAAIAQKLIAETIFYAKMDKLTEDSAVSLN